MIEFLLLVTQNAVWVPHRMVYSAVCSSVPKPGSQTSRVTEKYQRAGNSGPTGAKLPQVLPM